MATWSTWRKCTGVSPVTPGGPGLHVSSAGKFERDDSSLDLSHVRLQPRLHPHLHFWIVPVQERHWQTGESPAEDTKLVRKLEHKVGWGAKRGWGRRACSGPRKDSGVSSEMTGDMISKNQKLEHWTSSLDTGNNFLTTGAVKNWNRGCWCSL